MAAVRLKNLTKRFREVVAVDNVNLEVEDGEFLVLLGPSGCGKTTTLRCIAGLETPDEGEIYIKDVLVNDLPPKERDVAMVFQNYALYPHMNVFNNIAFPLKMHGVPKSEIERRVKEVAELLRITNLLERKPRQLSGGEAQRVALGRALVRNPKVFLMDEPLSNLDAKLRIYMRAEMKRLQKDLNVTMIYVTHDQMEAMSMASRIAVMHRGVLEQVATPDVIYNNPKSVFVAGFIGNPPMNFINVTFMEKNGECYLDAGMFVLHISDAIRHAVKQYATSSELILGVRPEDIIVHKKRVSEAIVEGKVYVLEPLGSEIILDLKVGENLIKAKVPPDFKANIGDNIWLSFDINRIHFFDKKTEKNLF